MAKSLASKHIPDREQRIRALKKYYRTVELSLSVHKMDLQSPCHKVDRVLNQIGLRS